jgi:hypothetical protein
VRSTLLILGSIVAVAAVALYLVFDAATASFFLVAGLIVSSCAASTTLLAAYTRNKAIRRQQELENAERIESDNRPPQ